MSSFLSKDPRKPCSTNIMDPICCADPLCGRFISDLRDPEVVRRGNLRFCHSGCEDSYDNPPKQKETNVPQTEDGQLLLAI